MIGESDCRRLLSLAERFPQTSLRYVEYEDLASFELLREEEGLLLLRGRNEENCRTEYHWAASSAQTLLEALPGGEAYLTFVPDCFRTAFLAAGFADDSRWKDYFHREVRSVREPESETERLREDECGMASEVTLACRFQSRGFTGETPAFFRDWLSGEGINVSGSRDSAVLVCRVDGTIAGLAAVCLYGTAEEPILWVREVAVHPDYQCRGIGGRLLRAALWYGKCRGAVSAFLAADECNTGAIRLYERMGFRAKEDDEGQLNMLREG